MTRRQEDARPGERRAARTVGAWGACLLAGLLLAPVARGTNIHVDATLGSDARDGSSWANAVATISRALDLLQASTSADSILVAAGTYAENVVVPRNNLTLAGGYPPGGGARDPDVNRTIVDGRATAPALRVDAIGVILSGIVVDGFTFTNGAPFVRTGLPAAGAGILIDEASVVLTNNVIEANTVVGDGLLGAGLYVYRWQARPSRIESNILRNNVSVNGRGGAAALLDFASPTGPQTVFSRNEVTGNVARAVAGSDETLALAQGGGLFVWGGKPLIASNLIASNVAESETAALFSGQGGGIFVVNASPFITNNTITSNVARSALADLGGSGGGMYGWWTGGDETGGNMTVAANTFTGNRAEGGTGLNQAAGGAIAVSTLESATIRIEDNELTSNVARGDGAGSGLGGAIFAWLGEASPATCVVQGGTVARNQAMIAGGGVWLQGGSPGALAVDGVLVEENEAGFGSGVAIRGSGELRNLRVRRNRTYDPDADAVDEYLDNCRDMANPVQSDADGDGAGDACDPDDDGDGVADASDPCPLVARGPCAGDADGDGAGDAADNCPMVANAGQADLDGDGLGDACEPATFDPATTRAGGAWVNGDARLTNLEITRNEGHGLLVMGTEADPAAGEPEDNASVNLAQLTIAANRASGFTMYLAAGSGMRDSIVADNELEDGRDLLRPSGNPSSPGVTCDGVYWSDGIAAMPCAGSLNLDTSDGPALFAAGLLGDFYLAQVAAGQPADFVAVDAGTRIAAVTPVAALTTRTDSGADAGQVDMGYHYDLSTPVPQPVEVFLRADRPAGVAAVRLTVAAPPAEVTAVRWYRGLIGTLHDEYSHATPFTGLPGLPECDSPPAIALDDASAIGDGVAYYYLVVDVSEGVEGTFGTDSFLVERTAPDDSPADLVTNACP